MTLPSFITKEGSYGGGGGTSHPRPYQILKSPAFLGLNESLKSKAQNNPPETLITLIFDGLIVKIVCDGMMHYHAKSQAFITICSTI